MSINLYYYIMLYFILITSDNKINKTDNIEVKSQYNIVKFLMVDKPNKESVYQALLYYDIKHPKIVLYQSILETGNYKSKLCIEDNNIFGIYDSKLKKYKHFKTWVDCILSYKYLQRRYVVNKIEEPDDYYNFLIRINYAEDPNYIKTLKQLVNE